MRDGEHEAADLARWLRALASEVERDPDLAARIAHIAGKGEAEPSPLRTPGEGEQGAMVVSPQTEAVAPQESPDLLETAHPLEAMPAPTLRHRPGGSRFGPPTVAGRGMDLGQGIPDPFALYAERGEDGLRQALEGLRAGTLRAIIRAYQLDPEGKLPASATEKRMATLIVTAARKTEPATRSRSLRARQPGPPGRRADRSPDRGR